MAVGGGLVAASAVMANPCERESAYYCIAVREDDDRPAGRTLILDDLRHAHVTLGDPTALEFAYVRWFAAGTADIVATDPDLAALHVGGGGFSFPRYLLAVAPDSRHDVLELDPVVLATAREELGFEPDERIDVALGDARRTIAAIADDSRAIVVGDAFGGRSVPWHLATVEFAREIDRVLAPGGRYVQNLIDGPSLRFVRAETATLRTVFEHVAVITWSAAFEGRERRQRGRRRLSRAVRRRVAPGPRPGDARPAPPSSPTRPGSTRSRRAHRSSPTTTPRRTS